MAKDLWLHFLPFCICFSLWDFYRNQRKKNTNKSKPDAPGPVYLHPFSGLPAVFLTTRISCLFNQAAPCSPNSLSFHPCGNSQQLFEFCISSAPLSCTMLRWKVVEHSVRVLLFHRRLPLFSLQTSANNRPQHHAMIMWFETIAVATCNHRCPHQLGITTLPGCRRA